MNVMYWYTIHAQTIRQYIVQGTHFSICVFFQQNMPDEQMLQYEYAVIHDYLDTCYVSNVVFNAVKCGGNP